MTREFYKVYWWTNTDEQREEEFDRLCNAKGRYDELCRLRCVVEEVRMYKYCVEMLEKQGKRDSPWRS